MGSIYPWGQNNGIWHQADFKLGISYVHAPDSLLFPFLGVGAPQALGIKLVNPAPWIGCLELCPYGAENSNNCKPE